MDDMGEMFRMEFARLELEGRMEDRAKLAEPAFHIPQHRQPKICPSCKSKMWEREVASGKCWNCGRYIGATGKLRASA